MPGLKTTGTRPKKKNPRKVSTAPKLSRQRRPAGMSTEEWQAQLRRQFGREQSFVLENLGTEPFYSEFAVTNPQSKGRYRVAIRGTKLGENFCSCPDFATNDLGTCKHVEFTLARLETKRGGKSALKAGFKPVYSEIYLHYAGERCVRLRAGSECPAALRRIAEELFDQENGCEPCWPPPWPVRPRPPRRRRRRRPSPPPPGWPPCGAPPWPPPPWDC